MWSFALLDTSFLLLALLGFGALSFVSILAGNEKGVSSTLTIIGILVALQLFTVDVKPFSFAAAHPVNTLGMIAGYLAVGVVYLYVRWRWVFIRDIKIAHDDFLAKIATVKDNSGKYLCGYSSMDAEFAHSPDARRIGVANFPIKVSDYREMLYCWNFFWPLLIIHSILKDPLRIFREHIGKVLQAVADGAFKK